MIATARGCCIAEPERKRHLRQDRREGRHGDRAQPVAARFQQRLPGRQGMGKLAVFGDVEDRHFHRDADDHGHAHHRGDVELDRLKQLSAFGRRRANARDGSRVRSAG